MSWGAIQKCETACITGLDLESTATYDNSKEVLGCTRLFPEAMGFLLPVWPEPLSALILPGRLFPCVPLTEMQGLAPDINLAQLLLFPAKLFPHSTTEGCRGVRRGSKCFYMLSSRSYICYFKHTAGYLPCKGRTNKGHMKGIAPYNGQFSSWYPPNLFVA